MTTRYRAPLETHLWLLGSELVLAAARKLIQVGWAPPALLTGALALANRCSRAALIAWRRSDQTRAGFLRKRNLPKRGAKG